MKAFITVIDDDGREICKDKLLPPVWEGILDEKPYQCTVKETRFSFKITQYADCKKMEDNWDE